VPSAPDSKLFSPRFYTQVTIFSADMQKITTFFPEYGGIISRGIVRIERGSLRTSTQSREES
jgi:hypothetical protein